MGGSVIELKYGREHLSATWDLSDPNDYFVCETCGPAYEELEISRDSGDTGWYLRVSYGCYSGASAEGLSTEEALAWLDIEGPEWAADQVDEAREWLRSHL